MTRRLIVLLLLIAVPATGTAVAAVGSDARTGAALLAKKKKKTKKLRVKGDVNASGFNLAFKARRLVGSAPTTSTGTFTGSLGDSSFKGPVTCMQVRGTTISLFYPVEETVPPGGEALGMGIFITVVTDGMGNATEAGFMMAPMDATEECGPRDTPMAAEGPATIERR